MLVYGATSSLDLNWVLGLLGFGEKREPSSDNSSNTQPLLQLFKLFPAFIIGWILYQRSENRKTNLNSKEVEQQGDEQGEQEHFIGELHHYFDAGGLGGCTFCGNFCTRRCSRCKAARYCSMECQVRHWRSGHKHECAESETAGNQANPIHDDGASKLVNTSQMESTSNGSHGDEMGWNSESEVEVEVSRGSDLNIFHGCEVCGKPITIRCSRCKVVKYCSPKCLVLNWRWHKDHCFIGDENSAPTERTQKNVEQLKNSYEEEDKIHSFGPLSLEFHPKETTHFKSPVKVSQDPTKETRLHGTKWVGYFEDEVAKSRNEVLLLQSERDEWKRRANFARELFQILKRESNCQLFVLKNEKESISIADRKASNVIHSLHQRINHLQNEVQESIEQRRKLEEHIRNLESESVMLKKELQEQNKRAQFLSVESNKSRETAQIAKRDIELVRQKLKEEHEHARRLTENFRRDVIVAEARAAFAEESLSDLQRKIRLSNCYKVCSICLTNEKDLAFGCGHMTCRDCGSKISKCPICREQITNHIKLFPG